MKIEKKIINKVVNVALYFFVIVFAGFAFLTFFNLPGDYRLFSVQSGSMEPTIKTGSVVFNKGSDTYQVGDIITYLTPEERIVTHRIVEVNAENQSVYYIVKGDANETADTDPVANHRVIGRVLFSVPFLGYLANFLKTPLGITVLVVIPATVVIWEEVQKIKKELKSVKRDGVKIKWWSDFKKRVKIAKEASHE